ncbi:MAG: YciI family protein [Dehalococcoidia bacterium]
MWYLVLSRWTVPIEQGAAYINDHLEFQYRNHQAGNILFSGPTPDLSVGIYVIRASSLDEAKRTADADPFHAQGVRQYEMLEWEVHQILGAGPFSAEAFGPLIKDHPDRYRFMRAMQR